MSEIRYADIVPDQYQNELISLRDSSTITSFRVGDIAEDCISFNADIEKEIVYRAVGSFFGKSGRTIREYNMVSTFYSYPVRQEFEMLAFDHFRVAMRYPNWREILEWCVAQVEDYNRPATVDAMLEKFAKQEDSELLEGEDVDHIAENQAEHEYDQLKNYFQKIRDIVAVADISLDEQEELMEDLFELEEKVKNIFDKTPLFAI